MTYKLVAKENSFDILEKDSNLTIVLDAEEKRAKQLCRKLNLGSGFGGWTPLFFAEKFTATYN